MTLDPDALRLHRTGNGDPLVLLHCLGMTHRLWDGFAPLADHYELISCDFPGHGETPLPPDGTTIEDVSRQLHGALRREGIGHAHIMGISLGGCVAQHFSATWPEMTGRLVLADTTPCYPDEARANWAVRARAARENGTAAMLPMIEKIWFTPGFVAKSPPELALVRESFAACPSEGYARACEALGAVDLRPLASRITAPTLVMCGAEETPAFKDAARWLHDNIAGSTLEWIASAAHASVLEQPQHTMTLLRDFLP